MVTAFIPVRGGSKSIPLKNIKPFCGKPLVCWNIEELEKCNLIDSVIIATDSKEIVEVVKSRNYKKTKIYWRSAQNASDTASTESVILEYLNYVKLPEDEIFMLVQATSPMTKADHFENALYSYKNGNFDSMLSCVRNYRFFWSEDGSSKNYDYRNRPRRQDFAGDLMENGAFYISSVANIKKHKNRLGGKIGIYEMPSYTAMEIDEPEDWLILENLKFREIQKEIKQTDIKLFLSDIDGTLTDGGMYYSERGDELKKFNTRDGMGFKLLKENGIKTGIITSENRQLNQSRADKLNVDFLRQGISNKGKLDVVNEICNEIGINISQVAYIGDDINDIELLSAVGLSACPQDANIQVKSIPAIHVQSKCGGDGCVREFADYILSNKDINAKYNNIY